MSLLKKEKEKIPGENRKKNPGKKSKEQEKYKGSAIYFLIISVLTFLIGFVLILLIMPDKDLAEERTVITAPAVNSRFSACPVEKIPPITAHPQKTPPDSPVKTPPQGDLRVSSYSGDDDEPSPPVKTLIIHNTPPSPGGDVSSSVPNSPSSALSSKSKLYIKENKMRDISAWNPQIQAYSKRHYGEDTYILKPTVIVLHFTVTEGFPDNLVESGEFEGETPGLAVHYVVDGKNIWRILPDNVRSRGAWGINHRAINIEMVAMDAEDLENRPETLQSCARLVKYLMNKHNIPLKKVYSHQTVSLMDRSQVPEVKDLVDPSPYYKVDPGERNLSTIKKKVKQLDDPGIKEK